MTTSFAYNGPTEVPARIIGTKGFVFATSFYLRSSPPRLLHPYAYLHFHLHHSEILIHGPGLSQLKKITVRTLDQDPAPMANKWKEDRVIERDFEGFGLHFEADAVGRSLKGEYNIPPSRS